MMSVPAVKSLSYVQIGAETTPGTAVAATRRLSVKNATYRRMEDEYTGEEELTGTLARTAAPPIPTKRWTEFEFTMPLDFDQSLLVPLAGVNGDVTSVANTSLWDWTFDAPGDDIVVPITYTLEYAEVAPGGDTDGMRAAYCFVTGFTITGGDNGVAEIQVSMVGRATQDNFTPTTGLALVPIERAPMLKWDIYVDDAWADLGDTEILGQVYNFNLEFRDHLRPEWYLDSRTDLSFSQYEVGHRTLDLALDAVVAPAASGLIKVEKTAKIAQALRFARLKITGATTPAQSITIDMASYHASDSMQERGADRNGSNTARFHLLSAYDPTEATDFEMLWTSTADLFPVATP